MWSRLCEYSRAISERCKISRIMYIFPQLSEQLAPPAALPFSAVQCRAGVAEPVDHGLPLVSPAQFLTRGGGEGVSLTKEARIQSPSVSCLFFSRWIIIVGNEIILVSLATFLKLLYEYLTYKST